MATKGYTDALLNTLPADLRKALQPAFAHVLDTFKLGGGTKALNFAWLRFTGTTAADAGTEFSIEHGLGQTPSKLIPVLDLTEIGSQLVPLTVSRAPDDRRIYLTSASTSAVFICYVEP